jgi:hypothetical protein
MFMKVAIGLLVVFTLIFFAPVIRQYTSSTEIHGSTDTQVQRSAMKVRRNLPTQQMHSFDVAFGLLKELKSGQGENAFAQSVGGKSTNEIVEMARVEVASKIAAGDPKFKGFTSWDDMLSKEAAQDAPKKASAPQPTTPVRNSERTGRGD